MLNKLLEKSEDYKRKVAFVVTGIIGIIIFAVWLIITQHDIKQAVHPVKQKTKTASQEFKESLPSLDTQETLTTELMKKGKNLEIK